ncbi:MAG: copper chaperone PCu(A)C [Gammaproteobacteria bacterium]|nr:copper chaperone PCu(A)C [Gammaproteobacteria bacterium]
MRLSITWLLIVLANVSSINTYAADSLMIHNAWVPEMPPVSRVHAGFASFHNASNEDLEIIAFSSPDYARIEMHLSKEVDGMARMIPQKSLIVQANKMLTLQHGSYHLMMFKPVRKLKSGDNISLSVQLSNGKQQSFSATVKSTMQNESHHHHH